MTAIIIHGSYGSPQENWFPWLASKLRERGVQVYVPYLPTPDGQDLNNWTQLFKIQTGSLTKSTILIGHSLAPAFILSLLESSDVKIAGTYLVAGFIGNLNKQKFDEVNDSFVNKEFDWNTIVKNAGRIQLYNAKDDPNVPLEKGEELSKKLSAPLNVIEQGGHLNFKRFPLLLEDIDNLLSDLKEKHNY